MSNKPIEFHLLGSTEAWQAGNPIPLSGARRRALVTRLLLDAGRAVPAETLLEDVWGDQAPGAASATLQSHLSQLRKVLGDRVQRSGAGYSLRLDAVSRNFGTVNALRNVTLNVKCGELIALLA